MGTFTWRLPGMCPAHYIWVSIMDSSPRSNPPTKEAPNQATRQMKPETIPRNQATEYLISPFKIAQKMCHLLGLMRNKSVGQ